jgi:hypothetical protein
MTRYRLRLFGRTIAELEIEYEGFELTIEPPDLETVKWCSDEG